jgi:histidine triad (HIT) family protein
MPTVFTKIIEGEIPCYKIAETDQYLAFLVIEPKAIGPTLSVPTQEINKLFDMEDDLYLGLMQFSKEVAIALEKTIPCKRVGMAVIGLEVPHVHVHLIPLNEMDEMRFQNKVSPTDEEFKALAKAISQNL